MYLTRKEEKIMNQFNVLNWDINCNELEFYDVLPYFRKCYEKCRKKDKPKTVDEWKEFIRQKGIYMFCSRCQYEIIISPWPLQKKDVSVKIDVWQQIKMNLDLIVELLMKEYNK